MKNFLHNTKRAVLVTVVLMIICGLIYPLVLTGISKVIFPRQAEGSLIRVDGKVVGAETIGQEFTEDYYMWGRPSAYHYNTYTEDENGNLVYSDGTEFAGVSSGSNNYAPTNEALTERVENDMEKFLERNPEVKAEDIPTDLLTASGSGLDPHISPDTNSTYSGSFRTFGRKSRGNSFRAHRRKTAWCFWRGNSQCFNGKPRYR